MMNIPKENKELLTAISSGNVDSVKKVLDKEEIGPMDVTLALPDSVMTGKPEVVMCLIDKGADIHYFDKGGSLPILVMAIMQRHLDVFMVLLDKCRNINVEYNKGNLAHAAIRIGNHNILEELKKRPDPFLLFDKADDKNGRTPLHEAVFVLIEKKDPSIDGATSFLNDQEIVQFFLEQKCNVNTRDRRRRTPLHDAARAGNCDIVMLLLNANADPYTEDVEGVLPWMDAILSGHDNLADILLKEEDFYAKIPHHVKNENHLFAAISARSMACVQYLIKRGFNAGEPQLIDREGVTPLIKALQLREAHISALLVRFSSMAVNCKTSTSYSAINYALDAWSDKNEVVWKRILDDLVKLGADLSMYVGVHNVHILMQRDYLVNIWKLDWVLSHWPDLNVRSKEGWYLFEVAVHHASQQRPSHLGLKILIRLLNHGMRVPEMYRYHTVHNYYNNQSNRRPRRSPTIEALKGRHIVLAYVLHLIGCRTPGNDLQDWIYNAHDYKSISEPAKRLVEYIMENEASPLPLQDIVRVYILDRLPLGNVKTHIDKFPLPVKLKQRLNWEVFIDTKPKELEGYYRVIKEMLVWQDDENDNTEWKGYLFEPDVTFTL